MKFTLQAIACVALGLCLVSCARDLDGVTGTADAGGGMGGTGGGMMGGMGGSEDAGMSGGGGGCIRPDELCPARYVAVAPGESCDGGTGGACRDEQPCGTGRRVYGLPNFENTLSCVYDSQGALVSATTCGYQAYNNLCRTQAACAAPGSDSCAGFIGACFSAGANVTCPAVDAGSD